MNIIVDTPRNFTEEQIDDFVILVETGGENVPGYATSRVKTAAYLALVYDEDKTPIATAAVKKPRISYRDSCFEKSNQDEYDAEDYTLEIGFMYVIPEKRNTQVATKMLNTLMKKEIPSGHNVFATTRTDNRFMIRILNNNNFIPVGKSWPSIVNPRNRIQLYIKK